MGLSTGMEVHELITNPPFTGKWILKSAGGINSRVKIGSLDAPNYPNICAPTVNFLKEDFSVLIALMFMF